MCYECDYCDRPLRNRLGIIFASCTIIITKKYKL